MSRLEDTPPDVLAILAGLCDDTANQQDMDKLEELVGEDGKAIGLVLDFLQLHSDLHFELTSRKASANVFRGIIDSEAANDPNSIANTAVPAESADVLAAERFIDYLGRNSPIHSTADYAPQSMSLQSVLFSYAVATVLVGIGLLVASLTPLSHPVQVVGNALPPVAALRAEPKIVFVGRITGLVDCEWADPNTAVPGPVAVPLGRKYALASGLLEIAYDTGATVILQGPCTYEVESAAGGFLSVGKLTAKVKKGEAVRSTEYGVRSRGRNDTANDQKSEIRNQKSSLSTTNYPLFTVKTPTATVTDLGTEFGVDVGSDGTNQVHVFQGRVELRGSAAVNGSASPIVLGKGQSARLAADGHEMPRSVDEARGSAATFIRQLPRAPGCIDLLDIVAGGDGAGKRRQHGINPTSGADEPAFVSKSREGNGKYSPVPSQRLIDGVFVPNGGTGPVQLDSTGHFFAGFPRTDGIAFGSIWARDALGQPDRQTQKRWHWICAMGRGDRYMPSRRGLLCLSANAGITFDLAEIRKARPKDEPVRFHAIAGMAGRGMADVWAFADGQLKFGRQGLRNQDGPINVGFILAPTDHFLTLVSTDGGNGSDCDWMVFGDPVLQVVPRMEEPAR